MDFYRTAKHFAILLNSLIFFYYDLPANLVGLKDQNQTVFVCPLDLA